MSMHVRCVDAAREAARLAARGDDGSSIARIIAPEGAAVRLRRDGDRIEATVTIRSALLPGVTVGARAVAEMEPGAS
jgi:hypothetical protein